MIDAKPWYQSKTLAFNALAFVLVVAGQFGFDSFTAHESVGPLALAVVTIGNALLRLITQEAVA